MSGGALPPDWAREDQCHSHGAEKKMDERRGSGRRWSGLGAEDSLIWDRISILMSHFLGCQVGVSEASKKKGKVSRSHRERNGVGVCVTESSSQNV